ncbi:MAG TPA: alpha/beta fold hydrolase [Candidatus Baltobacteraceae bacterium]|nr:alpha/beta fold hydrolase [Candidatus Baltobacteraceae bacterium]
MTSVESGFADVNGTRLYYETAGAGVPVVLIHGLGLDARTWDAQVDELASRYRVVRYDLRGFGRSAPAGDEPFRHADDLEALLAFLGVDSAHVVGFSMGGRIALVHALLHPERPRSLVLADAALDAFDWSDEWNDSFRALFARGAEAGPDAANALWIEHPLFAVARVRREIAAPLERMIRESPGRFWVDKVRERGIKPPAAQRLHELRVPALVIVGEHDVEDFRRVARRLAAEIPNARFREIAGAGHMTVLERPDAFTEALLTFFAETDA